MTLRASTSRTASRTVVSGGSPDRNKLLIQIADPHGRRTIDRTRSGLELTQQRAQQRSLSTPVFADDGDPVSPAHDEVNLLQHR